MARPKRWCSIPGCSAQSRARGWCWKHWSRWRRCGSPLAVRRIVGQSLAERFWTKVQMGEGCWEWRAARNPKGYGYFGGAGSTMAHRTAYTLTFGPVPAGFVVMHRCDNPPCVRPTHLTLGTIRDNNDDRDNKGRARRGSTLGVLRVTHCPRGHAYDEQNTRKYHNQRICRACDRARSQRRKAA